LVFAAGGELTFRKRPDRRIAEAITVCFEAL
jgi:hypothetical protein